MLFAGIDWSDRTLEYHLCNEDKRTLTKGTALVCAEGLADLCADLDRYAEPHEIGIAIESPHGPWIQELLDHGYRLYPVNPKAAERFRDVLNVAGNKTDKIDREALALLLAAVHHKLRPLQPDDPDMIALRVACQDRLRLVEERTAKLNELQAILKVCYPAFGGFFGDLDSYTALAFLQKYPTQKQMLAVSTGRLRNWLKRQHYTQPSRIEAMAAHLAGPHLTVAEHLQQARAPLVVYLARALTQLKREIQHADDRINRQFDAMPEAGWARSLPGAGEVLAPAIAACFGRHPNRYETYRDAQAFMGTAPVTIGSGQRMASPLVRFRRSCWKFARRTLQLFADHSRRKCPWAQALYQRLRARGQRHNTALRAVAHKWVKILFAMQRDQTLYDPDRFPTARQRYLSKQTV